MPNHRAPNEVTYLAGHFFTRQHVCRLLGISDRIFFYWARELEIRRFRVRGRNSKDSPRVVISRSDVVRLVRALAGSAADEVLANIGIRPEPAELIQPEENGGKTA